MNETECISIKNADLGYIKNNSHLTVLKNINESFFMGEMVGIVGINGIGKSTLLKSISGLILPLTGEIFINQRPRKQMSLMELSQQISVVLTEKIEGFNLTAYDIVASGQMPYSNSFHQLFNNHKAYINEAIKACNLSDHINKLSSELSDGLFQKTIIAKALAQQTPIMLLDEPSAFLDYASKHDIFILLKKLSEEKNKCILISSHDLDLLLKYCNRLLIISENGCELISTKIAKENKSFQIISGGYIKEYY